MLKERLLFLKILIICGSYPPDKCGVGEYTNRIVDNLVKDIDNDIYVLTSRSIINKNKIINFHERKWLLKDIVYFYKLISGLNVDIIHMQFPTKAYRKSIGIIILYIILAIKYKKVIITLHEYSDSPVLGKIRTLFLIIFSEKILVVDERYKKDLLKLFPSFAKKIEYTLVSSMIPKNNIQWNKNAVITLKRVLLQDFENKIIFGYFGFVNKSKGIETLINLGIELKKTDIKFKMLFVCELNSHDKYHLSIMKLIKDNKLTENIKITGYLTDIEVANSISICDFMIYPFVYGLSTKNSSFLAAEMQGISIITTKPKLNNHDRHLLNSNVYFIEKYDDINAIIDIIKQNNIVKLKEESIMVKDWNIISKSLNKIYHKM